jgi:hypothetical protein
VQCVEHRDLSFQGHSDRAAARVAGDAHSQAKTKTHY